MDQILTQLAGHTHGVVAYAAIFGVLVACGLGVPLPEDVSLVTGGFIAHTGAAHLTIMMVVGFLGIIAGDSIIYVAGRRVGVKVGAKQTGFFARIVTPEKRAKVEGLFRAHGQKIVMAARFLPGVRAVTFFTAGSAGMKYRWFILWDGMAALVSAPLLVFLGYYFGDELDMVLKKIRHGQARVIAVILILAVVYAAYSTWRSRRAKRQAALAPAQKAAGNGKTHGNGAATPAAGTGVSPARAAVSTPAAEASTDPAEPPTSG